MKIIILLISLISFSAFSQRSSGMFFTDLTLAGEFDTLTSDELNTTVKKNKSTFNQAMFTYGSDDPKEWELVSDYVLDHPEICMPSARKLDLNKDGFSDLIISMMAGSEYTEVGIYLGAKKGYTNILFEPAWFHGTFSNGDILLRIPACCDDPTNEYYRVTIMEDGTTTIHDSLSIATNVGIENVTHEKLFDGTFWGQSTKVLTARRLENPHEVYGSYSSGAQVRQIEEQEVEGIMLTFCEIKGELSQEHGSNLVYEHAFVWLNLYE